MTTQIYERYLCSFTDTGEHCGRVKYFKNFTTFFDEFDIIIPEINLYSESLQLIGQWQGGWILDHSNTSSKTYQKIKQDAMRGEIPENYEWNQFSVTVGERMYLTDLTLEEFQSGEAAWMASKDLSTQYQAYLDGLDQMRNDPNIVWNLDWTLVSTTP